MTQAEAVLRVKAIGRLLGILVDDADVRAYMAYLREQDDKRRERQLELFEIINREERR